MTARRLVQSGWVLIFLILVASGLAVWTKDWVGLAMLAVCLLVVAASLHYNYKVLRG